MKFIISSFWSESMQGLADLTWPTKADYAKRHGYEAQGGYHEPGVDIMWDRPRKWANMLDAAPDGTHCLFLGCDTMFTGDRSLENWITDDHDAHVLVDNAVVFGDVHCWKASNKTRTFMRSIADRTNVYGRYNGTEQDAFTSALACQSFQEYGIKAGTDYGTPEYYAHAQALLNSSEIKVKLLNRQLFAGDDPANWQDLPAHYAWNWDTLILHLGGIESAGNLKDKQNTRLMLIPKYLEEIERRKSL